PIGTVYSPLRASYPLPIAPAIVRNRIRAHWVSCFFRATQGGSMPRFLLSLALLLAAPLAARAEVKLPPILSSHMVLQPDLTVRIWGTGRPDETVTVVFRDQKKETTADNDGKWLVQLTGLKAGGPDKLTVSASNTITLDDVLVGEVWIGSGQSNMAGGVGGYAKGDPGLTKLLEGAPYPKVRLA